MAKEQTAESSTFQDPIIIDLANDELDSRGETQEKEVDASQNCKNIEGMKVDLVMWTHNSEKTLPSVLKRIHEVIPQQCVNRKIIADDYSKDRTREIAEEFGWEVHLNDGKGVNDNTQTAIGLVTEPIFCSFEHDIILERNWWEKLSKFMEDPKVAVAQGTRVSTNYQFRKLDDYSNKRDDVPHNSLDNCIARTEIVRKFGYNEVGTPPKLKAKGYKWIVDQTTISDHIRESMWENVKHDFRMQALFPATLRHRLLCFRMLLTSLVRAAHITYKTKCPAMIFLYPIDRLAIFLASFKKA
jgi:glycosyltransferase involved in cell wall biosynthesis